MRPKIIELQLALIATIIGLQLFVQSHPFFVLFALILAFSLTIYFRRVATLSILCGVCLFSPGSISDANLQNFELFGHVIDGPRFQPGGCRYLIQSSEQTWNISSVQCDALPGDEIETFVRPSKTRPFSGRAVDFYHQKSSDFSVRRFVTKSRSTWVKQTASLDQRGLPVALTTGNKAFISPKTTDLFRDLGISHLLAISGLHFGIIASLLWFALGYILNRFPSLILRFGKKKMLGPLVILGLYLFLLFVGSPISATRAFIMVSAYILGTVLSRYIRPCVSVFYALCALLIYDPANLENLGFQLSFCAVVGILAILNNNNLLRHLSQGNPLRHRFFSLLFVSIAAGLSTLPVLLHQSGQISWIAFPANILIVPLFSAVIFPLFLIAAFIFRFGGPFETLGEFLLNWITMTILRFVEACAFVPFLPAARSFPGEIPRWVAIVLFFGIVYFLYNLERLRIFAIFSLLIGAVGLVYFGSPDHPKNLQIHFIDVGQGDSILIQMPSGENVLIDTGGTMFGSDPGQRIVAPYIKRRGVGKLDAIVITHDDKDHNGGLPAILRTLQTERVIENVEGTAYLKRLGFESFKYTAEHASKNNRSLVLKLVYGKSCIVFTGDIEETAEMELANKLTKCAILKIAHHGSKTSSSAYFLDRVDPIFAIISAGRNNHFGHPHINVVDRLRKRGIEILSTQKQGSIVLDIDRDGIIKTTSSGVPKVF